MPLLIVPIWTSLKARKRSPGNAAFRGRKLKNATCAAACQPSCRRSFPLKFASKYYPLHSLLSPITGSLSAHLIHRQPVAQRSALLGGCQAVSPSSSSRIRRLLQICALQPLEHNTVAPSLEALLLVSGPSLSRNFLLFPSAFESYEIFQGSAQSCTSSRKSSQTLLSPICLRRLGSKCCLMPSHIYSSPLGIFL